MNRRGRKTVSDLFLPLSGEITEFNDKLEAAPEVVNQDPYGAGWIIKMKIDDKEQIKDLLDAQAYGSVVNT